MITSKMGEGKSMHVQFTSELFADQAEELEGLLFFNKNQRRYRDVIVDSVERFGEPRIRIDRGRLRLHTRLLGEVQSLFAVASGDEARSPIAVAVYARTSRDTMTLLHIAVHEDFTASGPFAEELVSFRLIREVLRAVSRIRGVERLEMLYGAAGEPGTTIPVRRPGRSPSSEES